MRNINAEINYAVELKFLKDLTGQAWFGNTKHAWTHVDIHDQIKFLNKLSMGKLEIRKVRMGTNCVYAKWKFVQAKMMPPITNGYKNGIL